MHLRQALFDTRGRLLQFGLLSTGVGRGQVLAGELLVAGGFVFKRGGQSEHAAQGTYP